MSNSCGAAKGAARGAAGQLRRGRAAAAPVPPPGSLGMFSSTKPSDRAAALGVKTGLCHAPSSGPGGGSRLLFFSPGHVFPVYAVRRAQCDVKRRSVTVPHPPPATAF